MRFACLLASSLAIAACSPAAEVAPPADAGDGSNQAIGTPCKPALADPCSQPSDVCSVAVCDPTSLLCVRVLVDAGPTCSNGSPPLTCGSDDCDASAEAGEAASADGAVADAAVEAGESGELDASGDATAPADGGDASNDAPAEAADATGE
jgi:hypothetical protein